MGAPKVSSALLCGLGLLAGASTASGQEAPRARLDLQLTPGAERCPSADDLRAAVAARLGRDPIDPTAPRVLRIRVVREGAVYRATLQQLEGERSLGQGVLTGRRADCADLGAALALAVGLALDPLAHPPAAPPPATPPSPPPPPAPPALPPPEPPPPPPPPPPLVVPPIVVRERAPADPVRWVFGAEVVGTVSSLPGPTVGPGLLASLRYRRFAASVTARYDLGASAPLQGGGDLYASLFAASLQACVTQRIGARGELDLCVLGSVGALSANATSLDRSTPEATTYVGAGASVGFTWRLGPVFGVRLHVDAVANIVRARHTVIDAGVEREVWLAPPASAIFGIGPVVHFG